MYDAGMLEKFFFLGYWFVTITVNEFHMHTWKTYMLGYYESEVTYSEFPQKSLHAYFH